jgi:hypothetical protein
MAGARRDGEGGIASCEVLDSLPVCLLSAAALHIWMTLRPFVISPCFGCAFFCIASVANTVRIQFRLFDESAIGISRLPGLATIHRLHIAVGCYPPVLFPRQT